MTTRIAIRVRIPVVENIAERTDPIALNTASSTVQIEMRTYHIAVNTADISDPTVIFL
jgi:hypothetical protein